MSDPTEALNDAMRDDPSVFHFRKPLPRRCPFGQPNDKNWVLDTKPNPPVLRLREIRRLKATEKT